MGEILLIIGIALFAYVAKSLLSTKPKIQIELIPYNQSYKNVRAVLSIEKWQSVAKHHYKKANHRCEICNAQGRMECHEMWQFSRGRQILVGMVSLCHNCHGSIHYGHSIKYKPMNEAVEITAHIMRLNNWKRSKLETEFKKAKATSRVLAYRDYALDLTLLNSPEYKHLYLGTFTKDESKNCNPKMIY